MSEGIAVAELLPWDFEKLPMRLTAAIEATPDLASLKGLMTRLAPAQWASLLPALAGKVRELLDIPVTKILARGWKDLGDVRKALDTTRQDPERTEEVTLADHTISSEHKPSLDLYENGKQLVRIPFVLLLEIELRALTLEIEKGAVRRVDLGDFKITGTLKVFDFTLAEKESDRVRLPGSLHFAEGDA